MPLLSVIVPVYNERTTIEEVLRRVEQVPIDKEIIVIDDCSQDGTREILRANVEGRNGIRVLFQDPNQGKGAALARGFREAIGDIVLVQDADFEYDPRDYPKLIAPIVDGEADVVYGSRFTGSPRRVLYFWHTVGNRLLTLMSNMMTNLNLTDMETCYKVFRRDIIKSINLQSKRFGFEPEITAKLAKMKVRIYEVPISYHGRSYEEGKKITWRDGFAAFWHITRFSLFSRAATEPQGEMLETLAEARRFNRWMHNRIEKHTGSRVLEVGSGHGNLTKYFLRKDLLVATDCNAEYISVLQRQFGALPNCRVERLDLGAFDPAGFAADRLDTVVCLNVLEHIEDDLAALRALRESLQPGGKLILLVPAHPSLYGSLDEVVGHHRRYTRAGLRARVEAAGFRVIREEAFNLFGIIGWFINGKILRRKQLPAFQLRMFDRLVFLFKIEALLRLPFGLSRITICERPKT